MDRDAPAPAGALVLGAAGLIPFLGLALLLLLGRGEVAGLAVRPALAAYAAVIASFLGGIRWGAASRGGRQADYVVAVAPSLLAWAALAAPAPWDLRLLGALVLIWGAIDQDMPRRGLVPRWLGRLRLALSGVAGFALLAAGYLAG
ncbi:conserved hypothetical protein [Methylobacterium sp. 4-46]|uniref:DUF3429 domain-containing protein n=1 Tax=unclassified Methylobacterium TaxID=2615210 RepID=UPI000152DDAE|nr:MULTISPECIES: DUF3429 domain-containing protein [Methylobacterium]ACA17505.1 conserved hypothetical protein [Methylobacterium sp. 4-46]WFT83189.1 DUF3429 domain-containing protein [Methylobacterium nodulans]